MPGLGAIAKRIALLKEVAPGMSKVAVLILRPYWEGRFGAIFREVAQQLNVTVIGAPFDSHAGEAEYRQVFAELSDQHPDGLYVTPSLESITQSELIAQLAVDAHMPSIGFYRESVAAGGLMAYGPDIDDVFRRAAGYVDQILKGADPAEMPIQQPVKFDLILNLKTADALGLTVPPTMLALADEILE